MRCAVLSVLLLANASVVGAPSPFPKPDRRTEWDKLQGEWELVGVVFEGETHLSQGSHRKLVIARTGSWLWLGGWCKVRVDARSEPKGMDFAYSGCTLLCIYRLDGGRLTIRRGTTQERPQDFNSSTKWLRYETLVFERTKPR